MRINEWAEGHRYLGLDVLARVQALDAAPTREEVTQPTIQAITASSTTAKDHFSSTMSPDLTESTAARG